MDIFEPTPGQTPQSAVADHDLISFSTNTNPNAAASTTATASNNNINHSASQNSTSSGYGSGRSTPNTLLNRLNKLSNAQQQQQQQYSLPSIDDFLLDNELLMLQQQQHTATPKHQQQLQLLNDEIQNRLFNAHQNSLLLQQQPINSSYRSLSLNNVLLQSPTRQIYSDAYAQQHQQQQQQQQQPTAPAPAPQPSSYNTLYSNYRRERSLDRSLSSSLLTPASQLTRQRSLSARRDDNNNNGSSNSIKSLLLQQQQQQQQVPSQTKVNYSKELQIKLLEMQKEITYLKCELELTSQKLQSSVQSIKTFWSPELKKERQARKDESMRYHSLYEKYKMLINSNGIEHSTNGSPLASTTNENLHELTTSSPISSLNKLIKENNLLKKTISELEMRISSQKQVINSKDETIKNLFMLLNNKENNSQQQQQHQMIADITEFNDLKESFNVTIEQQAQHIKYLEGQNQLFQDELKMIIQQSPLAATTTATSLTTQNQIELYKTNEKFFKEKIESLKFELNRKDNEIQTLKTKYESVESKEKDLQHYLNLLKESISTKDQQSLILQSEINDLRNRLRDKEAAIEKKQQQIQTFQLDKHQRDSDLLELRDQMDIKDRKLNVLNRKIDNLEEQLKDKELQIQTLRTKLGGSNTSTTNYASEIISLEHEKERLLERLNQSKSVSKEQLDALNESVQQLKELNEKKDKEIIDYQNDILDLKDELGMLKTQLIHKDSHINSLELSLTQKHDEMEKIEEKLNRMKQQQQFSSTQVDTSKKHVQQLQKELQLKETQLNETHKELNILKDLISNFELQKEEMMNKLEQQQHVFDNLQTKYEQQIKQQQEQSNAEKLTTTPRVSELEDALRQSVAITAEREILMAKQKTRLEKVENENKNLINEIEKMKKYLNEQRFQFERLQEDFIRREEQLQQLEEEKVKEMNELLIAKQEALLTAISEKDSNIANLEMDKSKTQTHLNEINRLYEEKDNLHHQLKELNEKRMKLMQDHIHSKDAKDKVKMLVLSIKTANDEDGLYA